MAGPSVKRSRGEIEREAENHITLGMLLRRVRKPEQQRAVEAVLASRLSIRQKIEKIRALDLRHEHAGEEQAAGEIVASPPPGQRAGARRAQLSLKAPVSDCGYFAYLLRERRQLRDFGRSSHVFQATLLPPGVRINPEIKGFLITYVVPWAAELQEMAAQALDVGWLYLNRHGYNLLAVLRRLCSRIAGMNFPGLNYADRTLIERLRPLENLFLVLHFQPTYPEEVVEALHRVCHKEPGCGIDFDHAADLVHRLLWKDVTLPSLYNCLLGLNMVRHRRFLTLRGLIRRDVKAVIDTQRFDCDPQVQRQIDEYVAKAVDGVQSLHEQLHEVRRFKRYLRFQEDGALDLRPLAELYDSVRRAGAGFAEDRENVLLLAPRFLRVFEQVYLPLLNGRVVVGRRRVILFSRVFFQVEFSKLHAAAGRLERVSLGFPNFPYRRYLEIRASSQGAISVEAEALQAIDDALAQFLGIGRTLARILSLRRPPAELEKFEPLEPIILKGKPFSFPSEEEPIRSRDCLNGKSLVEAVMQAIVVCFTAGVYFRDPYITLLISREEKLRREIRSTVQNLEHLLDAGDFRELQARYLAEELSDASSS